MKTIAAKNLHFSTRNENVRTAEESDIMIAGCMARCYIAAGISGRSITIEGTPENALAAYLDDCTIMVNGLTRDATGHGMRGGNIYVRDDVGWQAFI